MNPDAVKAYLDALPESDRVKAAAWDAVFDADDTNAQHRIDRIPISNQIRADLWDLRAGIAVEPVRPSMTARAATAIADLGIGAAKGALHTVGGLGRMARAVPGVNALDQIMTPIPINTTPTTGAQRVGYGAEQIGEFFVPTGVAGKGQLVADVLKSGVLTHAQGGSPTASGVSMALTAASPLLASAGSRALSAISGRAQQGAEKAVAQSLGATKEGMKTTASGLAPQMLKRGIHGSRGAMLQQAREQVRAVGGQIGDEVAARAAAGQTVNGLGIRVAVQMAADTLKVKNADGLMVPIAGAERTVRRLNELDAFVASLGDDIPFDKAQKIKVAWDRIVSKAGLYTNKATATASDNASAWAVREGASAFREAMNTGSLEALNKEYQFWKGLRTVLSETQRRTQSQASQGLIAATKGGAAGAVIGASLGGISGGPVGSGVGALLGNVLLTKLYAAMQSPWWKSSAAGPFKATIAQALSTGSRPEAQSAVIKMISALPAQITADDPTIAPMPSHETVP